MTTKERCDAYEAGWNARKAGLPATANPHADEAETFGLWGYWSDGWRSAGHENGITPGWYRRAMND